MSRPCSLKIRGPEGNPACDYPGLLYHLDMRTLAFSVTVFSLLLLFHCGSGAGLKDTKWLCNGSADVEERKNLDFPGAEEVADPSGTNPEGYIEVYHKDGLFEALDPVTGANLLDPGVSGSFELSGSGENRQLLFTFRHTDANGEEIVEEEPYKILELTEKRYHSISEAVPEVPELFESKCIRLGSPD